MMPKLFALTLAFLLATTGVAMAQLLPDLTVGPIDVFPRHLTAMTPFEVRWTVTTSIWDIEGAVACEVTVDGELYSRHICFAFQEGRTRHPGLPAGRHTIVVEVDADRSVQERDEDNNSRERNFDVGPPDAVDWSVRRFRAPHRVGVDTPWQARFTTRGTAGAAATCAIRLDGEQIVSSDCLPNQTVNVDLPGLDPGYHAIEAFLVAVGDPETSDNHRGRVITVGPSSGLDVWAPTVMLAQPDRIEASVCLAGGRLQEALDVGVWLARKRPPACGETPDLTLRLQPSRNQCQRTSLDLPVAIGNRGGWLMLDPDCALPEVSAANNLVRLEPGR